MPRCEDYPCCGHGPPPHGDGGGCPDEEGRFKCVLCGKKMPENATSAICEDCKTSPRGRELAEDALNNPDDGPDDY
ncbi:MAG: hypothetical protein Q8Q14_16525 [Gemmatimonadales bacterium]|nr:hypothetical protein [Gemmatimonadales bacterium]